MTRIRRCSISGNEVIPVLNPTGGLLESLNQPSQSVQGRCNPSVYDCNGPMVVSELKASGATIEGVVYAKDDLVTYLIVVRFLIVAVVNSRMP